MNLIMYILPELFISLLLMTLLMLGVFINKSFKLVNFLTIIGLIFSIVLVFNQPEETQKIFGGSYVIDSFSLFVF